MNTLTLTKVRLVVMTETKLLIASFCIHFLMFNFHFHIH